MLLNDAPKLHVSDVMLQLSTAMKMTMFVHFCDPMWSVVHVFITTYINVACIVVDAIFFVNEIVYTW